MARIQPQIPQLSINGGAFSPNSLGNGSPNGSLNGNGISAARSPKSPATQTPTSTIEVDSAWGANFWVTLIEPQSQTPFYACPATGQVNWDPPVGNFVLPPSVEGEWWELVDESRGGLPYYYHTKTNETVWERPEGFVIPLAILQNTALCRRLSVRYSQALDPEAVKAYVEKRQSMTINAPESSGPGVGQAKSAMKRSTSENNSTNANTGANGVDTHRRRTASSSASTASTPTVRLVSSQSASPGTNAANTSSNVRTQTPKRPGHGHNGSYGHGHFAQLRSQLPTIPASPYQSQTEGEEEASIDGASAASGVVDENARAREVQMQREKERVRQERLREEEREREREKEKESIGRARGKTSPRPHQHQQRHESLSAVASRLAPTLSSQSVPPTPTSPSSIPPVPPMPGSASSSHGHDGGEYASVHFTPQAASSPARSSSSVHGLSVNTGLAGQRGKDKESALPTPTSPVSLNSPKPPSSPNSQFSSLSRGKGAERAFGAQNQNQNRIPPPLQPPMPPRSLSSNYIQNQNQNSPTQSPLRTQDIGTPVFNTQATMNMSPVKARAEGKPILLDMKNSMDRDGDGTRYSTGGRPVLPDELAEEIQQFGQGEFAKQYFTTHRTGFIFRKKIPVEKMMVWQKAPLQSPLLLLNRMLHKDAVKTFKVIQRIMGDRDRDRPIVARSPTADGHLGTGNGGPTASVTSLNASSTSLPTMVSGILEEERWLLGEGISHGELRDEIYCQLVKQLTGNSIPESLFKGWQLMCVLLVTFPPSKNFEAYLRAFIQQNTTQTEGRVDVMAKYCLQRLTIISKKGPRGKAPPMAEIETASDAAFNPSTFGESLDAIIRLQERTYPHLQVPIILPFLADGILALGGTKSEGIFRIPGDGDSVSELKIRIGRGYYNLEGVDDPHVPASLLKLWLRELCDPLVPTELYNDCVACAKDPEACVGMVSRLPTIHRRVVLFVISFLQLFLDEKIQAVTKMTSANLALVMAPNLLRCDSESMTVVFTNAPYEQMFVHNLLLHLKCNRVDPGYVPKHGLGTTISSSKPRNRRPVR